jgi:pimeloyl-ACP methyl ester carboxylesterase
MTTGTRRVLSGVGGIAAFLGASGGVFAAEPLVIEKQGSFFVNGKTIVSAFPSGTGTPAPGNITVNQMYVQYQIPQARTPQTYPVVMVHGSAHTGKTYDETPDGREGWQTYFLRKGIPVYVVDHAGRARSGFDPTPSNQARLQSNSPGIPSFTKFTDENAWGAFRIGSAPFIPYATTQFPVEAFAQYSAQLVPNTETSLSGAGTNTINALAALLEKVGPAIVMVHSQSGAYGLGAAIARPGLVKAVVSVEPRTCAVSDSDVRSVFTQVPLLTVFGDFIEESSNDWAKIMAECIETVGRITAAGGLAKNIHLPEAGYIGNSHMLMMDRNNLEIADWILKWLDENVDHRRPG